MVVIKEGNEMTTQTITILAERLPEACKALDKLVRKANKYGQQFSYAVGPKRVEEHRTASGRKVKVHVVDVTLAGPAPKIGEYEFIARIEFINNTPLICTSPMASTELPESFRTTDARCEHCGHDRMRRDVFVVRNAEGNFVQVGRTCLKDYMGVDAAEMVARFNFFKSFRETAEGFGVGKSFAADMTEILAYTATAIRLWGWCAKSSVDVQIGKDTPTAALVLMAYDTSAATADIRRQIKSETTESDYTLAKNVIVWAQGLKVRSDYEYNMQAMLSQDTVYDHRHFGLICSAVVAYQRHLGAQEQKMRDTQRPSEWIGTKGERMRDLKVLVTDRRSISTFYGTSVLVKMVDENGNQLAWFASGNAEDMETGKWYVVDCGVKEHSVYNEVKQTMLTRVKVKG